MKSAMMTAVLVAGLASEAGAASLLGHILAQGNNGDVYKVNVTTGVATLFRDLDDQDPANSAPEFSPNGLGFDQATGDLYRTDFGGPALANTLYRDNDAVGGLPGDDFAIASGAISRGNYYYGDGAGNFAFVAGVGALPAGGGAITPDGSVAFADDSIFGDLVIKAGRLFMSYTNGGGSVLEVFDLAELLDGDGDLGVLSSNPLQLFAGLAFSGDSLYGVRGNNTLYAIDPFAGTANLIGPITGLPDGVGLTDAASVVPLPAAGWLLISSLLGLGWLGRRRATVA